jgi:hypothetical protein
MPKNPVTGSVFTVIKHDCKYTFVFNGNDWELKDQKREVSANWYGEPCCDVIDPYNERVTNIEIGGRRVVLDFHSVRSIEVKIDIDTSNGIKNVGQSFLILLRVDTLDFSKFAILGDSIKYKMEVEKSDKVYIWITNTQGHPMSVTTRIAANYIN